MAFDGTEEHYKNSSALFTISFDGEETDPATVEAMNEVLSALEATTSTPPPRSDGTSRPPSSRR